MLNKIFTFYFTFKKIYQIEYFINISSDKYKNYSEFKKLFNKKIFYSKIGLRLLKFNENFKKRI